MDDWGNRYEGRATQARKDPNAEARRFAASQEFARKTMERMLRRGEEEERERHENQTTQGASASKGTQPTNDVESGRRAAAASRDVEGCPDWPHVKEAKMSFGHLKKRGKRKIKQYIFLYCGEAHCLSCAARCVAEPPRGVEIPGLRLSDASRVRFIKVDCQTATGITWLYLAMASWNIDLCGWSEDDYSGHYYDLNPASCSSCHGWPEMGKASRTSRFTAVLKILGFVFFDLAWRRGASKPRWAPRLQPPTQRNAHQHKHANTKTHTKIHKTQTPTKNANTHKHKNTQTDVAIPTQTSKEQLHMVYREMHLSIRHWGIVLSGQSVV